MMIKHLNINKRVTPRIFHHFAIFGADHKPLNVERAKKGETAGDITSE
jgi:hypothetical protein